MHIDTVRIKLKKLKDTREWKVEWWQEGVLDEAKSYYTDDLEDALLTLKSMEREALVGGRRTVEVNTLPMNRWLMVQNE